MVVSFRKCNVMDVALNFMTGSIGSMMSRWLLVAHHILQISADINDSLIFCLFFICPEPEYA